MNSSTLRFASNDGIPVSTIANLETDDVGMTGHHFQLFKRNGRWYWQLQGSHFPTGPIARCRHEGYQSEVQARNSMRSACKAMKGAVEGDDTYRGKLRCEQIEPPATFGFFSEE